MQLSLVRNHEERSSHINSKWQSETRDSRSEKHEDSKLDLLSLERKKYGRTEFADAVISCRRCNGWSPPQSDLLEAWAYASYGHPDDAKDEVIVRSTFGLLWARRKYWTGTALSRQW